jgi:hypothetical protein
VADELGMVLTGMQEVQVDGLIEEAEAAIDHLAADRWLETSPVTFEPHTPTGPYVELLNRPVTAVTAVRARALSVGVTPATLVAGDDYELIDAARGTLLIPGRVGQWVEVSYTFAAPVPTDIRRATTLLVAAWMLPRLLQLATPTGIDTVTVADVTVKYQAGKGADAGGIPDRVRDLVMQARRPIFV